MSAVMPGMAAAYAFHSEPHAFYRAMKSDGLGCILRARRVITAAGPQPGAQEILIAANEFD